MYLSCRIIDLFMAIPSSSPYLFWKWIYFVTVVFLRILEVVKITLCRLMKSVLYDDIYAWISKCERLFHYDVIKWKHFPRYWPFVWGIHRSPVNSPHKGQWRRALMFSLISAWINGWVNNREVGDLRRQLAHYDVIVMFEYGIGKFCWWVPHLKTYHWKIHGHSGCRI